MKSILLALTLILPQISFAGTPTTEMIAKCQSVDTREQVLKELEKEAGLNFDLQSLSGDEALSSLVDDVQNRRLSEKSAATLAAVRRVLKIARTGVEAATKESLAQGLNREGVAVMSDLFLTMMDIFSPVLDLAEQGFKLQQKGGRLSESDILILMGKIAEKTDLYAKTQGSMLNFQIKIEKLKETERLRLARDLDQFSSNVQKQTCLAAVRDFRR